MSQEPGFEVAAAYVTVTPNAADFAEALDEQVGGISISAVVAPNASDFAASLDEQIGGLSTAVTVTPNATDFADALDEQIGGLTATVTLVPNASDFEVSVGEQAGTVGISVIPNAADFEAALDEQVGGLTVAVAVIPDASDFAAALDEQVGDTEVTVAVRADPSSLAADLGETGLAAGLGGIGVTVTPNMANFADAVQEEAGGIVVPVTVAPAMGDFADAVQEQADNVQAVVPVVPDAATLAASIEDQVGDEAITIPVTADTSSAVASVEALEDAAADDSGIQTLYNGILSIGPAATQAEMEAVDAMTSIGGTAATVTGQVSEIGPAAASAGADVSGAFTQGGEAASAADSGIQTFLSGIYSIGPAADEAQSQVVEAMGNARQAIADDASAIGSVDYTAATAGLGDVAGAADDVAKAAPAAADASSGLSGVLSMLAERMSYMAVDPFMWMYAAPVVIEGVSAAISGLSSISGNYVTELAKQDDATGYNISGYQKLSDQLGVMAQAYTASSDAVAQGADMYGRAAAAANALADVSAQYTQQEVQAANEADNLVGSIGSLQQQYGLTAVQAEDLTTAAGVSWKTLAAGGPAAAAAMQKIEAYAQSNLTAAGAVSQLSTDQAVFNNDTLTATARITDLDNAYTTLAGNFVSEQQAQLTVQQGFNTLGTDAEVAGASMKGTNAASVTLQQGFYSQASAIEQAANAMVQQGDSTQQVTSYINTQIGTLSTFEGGNKNASLAVQDLKKWEDSLNGSLETQANYMSTTLSNDLQNAILGYSGVQTAVNKYADALVDFGSKSPQAANAQAQVNDAITKGGLAAGQTTNQIATMISQIDKIPLKEAIQIVLNAEGQYSITDMTAATDPYGSLQAKTASGWLVSGGVPGKDSVPILAMPGELVVPTSMVDAGAVDHLRGRIPGFAGGGLVSGSYTGSGPGLGAFLDTEYGDTTTAAEVQLIGAMMGAESQAITDAKASAKAHALGGWLEPGEVGLVGEAGAEYIMGGPTGASVTPAGSRYVVNFNYYGTQYPTPEMRQAMLTDLSATIGVS